VEDGKVTDEEGGVEDISETGIHLVAVGTFDKHFSVCVPHCINQLTSPPYHTSTGHVINNDCLLLISPLCIVSLSVLIFPELTHIDSASVPDQLEHVVKITIEMIEYDSWKGIKEESFDSIDTECHHNQLMRWGAFDKISE
jgi:hypothetical protein